MSQRFVSFLLTGILSAFLSTNSFAQGTGAIAGVVEDETGAAIPGATVRAVNENTGIVSVTVSDTNGRFTFPRLLVGSYRIEAERESFRKFVTAGIKLDVDAAREARVVMQVGQVSETITVPGAVLQIETVGGALKEVVDQKRIEELPLNGRNALQLQLLIPGVNRAPGVPNLSANQGFSVNGARGLSNNYLLDGGDNNDPLGGSAAITPNPDALAEFSIHTNNFSAEFGRNMGGVINAVTKAGGNAFHGTLYEFIRNDALDARDFFALVKGKLRRNQFGGTIGGPIVRNHTFFFFSFEGLRERRGATFSSLVVPTAAERSGDFSASARKPNDPVTGQPFPNNRIPSSRFDPAAVKFLETFIPLPNSAGGGHIFNRPFNKDGDQWVARGDHQLTANQRLFARLMRDGSKELNTAGVPLLQSDIKFVTWNVAVNHTYTISPRLLNSAQFTFGQSFIDRGPLPVGGGDGVSYQSLGVKVNRGAPDPGLVPHYRGQVTGFWNLNQDNLVAIDRKTFQWLDQVTYTTGPHSFKFGGEYRRTSNDRITANLVDPQFFFTGRFTNNAFADFLLGRADRMEQGSLRNNQLRADAFSFYLQDDYKLTPRLTLTLGLRYDPFFPFRDVNVSPSQISVFRPGRQSTLFPTAPLGLVYGGDLDGEIPDGGSPPDWNNLAPRIALAWNPLKRTSVRAAYGIFYDTPRYFNLSNGVNSPPFSAQVRLNAVSFSDPYAGRVNPFPYTPPQTQSDREKIGFFLPAEIGLSVAPDLVAGYNQQWNLNIQHELQGDFIVTAAYVGSKGTHLPIVRQINPAIFRPGATVANIDQRRIYAPNFASISSYDPIGFSTYNALQLTLNKRFSRGYTILANYTFGKTLDNSSQDAFGGQNPLDPNADKGLAEFHRDHRVVTSFLWELPSVGQGITRRLLGGWQLNGILTMESGSPFTVTSGRDVALSGTGTQRPNLVGNPHLDTGRPKSELIKQYFNTNAFRLPPEGSYGSLGRNTLAGPGFWNLDFAVFKKFTLREKAEIQFRTELFNALNHANLGTPESSLASARVGEILTASTARVIQFGLKVIF